LAPIAPVQLSLFRLLFIGIVIGGLLGSLLVIGRMIYRAAY